MTASAAPGDILGQFDVYQLKAFRELAERHLSRALERADDQNRRLVAAADPNQFIDDSMIEEFAEAAFAAWSDGFSVLSSVIGAVETTPLFGSVVDNAIRNSTSSYYDVLNKLIGDKAFKTLREPIFGEFLKGSKVQFGDVRPLLVSLGGGSPDNQSDLVGGVTSGKIARDWLGQNGSPLTNEKIWLYGSEEPRRTFNGHLQMDGLVFTDWDDEGLLISPQDVWLRRSHYAPGDHQGCGCVVAPFIPNFGPEFTLDI